MSKFSERLEQLLFYARLNPPQFAEIIGCKRNTINRYLNGSSPKVEIFVRMANYFQCTSEFLLGLEEENSATNFKECPPFSQQLKFLLEHFKISKYKLKQGINIAESAIYSWQNGATSPTMDSVIKIAKFFNRSIDFILGREV